MLGIIVISFLTSTLINKLAGTDWVVVNIGLDVDFAKIMPDSAMRLNNDEMSRNTKTWRMANFCSELESLVYITASLTVPARADDSRNTTAVLQCINDSPIPLSRLGFKSF